MARSKPPRREPSRSQTARRGRRRSLCFWTGRNERPGGWHAGPCGDRRGSRRDWRRLRDSRPAERSEHLTRCWLTTRSCYPGHWNCRPSFRQGRRPLPRPSRPRPRHRSPHHRRRCRRPRLLHPIHLRPPRQTAPPTAPPALPTAPPTPARGSADSTAQSTACQSRSQARQQHREGACDTSRRHCSSASVREEPVRSCDRAFGIRNEPDESVAKAGEANLVPLENAPGAKQNQPCRNDAP
jgi:hypothetical protein